jgi:hypothetical protein
MAALDTDKVFPGSVPALYESHLVPLVLCKNNTPRMPALAAGKGGRQVMIEGAR